MDSRSISRYRVSFPVVDPGSSALTTVSALARSVDRRARDSPRGEAPRSNLFVSSRPWIVRWAGIHVQSVMRRSNASSVTHPSPRPSTIGTSASSVVVRSSPRTTRRPTAAAGPSRGSARRRARSAASPGTARRRAPGVDPYRRVSIRPVITAYRGLGSASTRPDGSPPSEGPPPLPLGCLPSFGLRRVSGDGPSGAIPNADGGGGRAPIRRFRAPIAVVIPAPGSAR